MHGPASTTVQPTTVPSLSNIWTMPSFFPKRPSTAMISAPASSAEYCVPSSECAGLLVTQHSAPSTQHLKLDLDIHARRQLQPHERVHRLARRLQDVDQALVRAHLELLARVLVDERTADHRHLA